MNPSNVPQEMRFYNQWVMWKFEDRGQGKKSKQPYSAHTKRLASPTNPADWSSFDQAFSSLNEFDGLGFVFTQSDPFCFIDFDDPFEKMPDGSLRFPDASQLRDYQIAIEKAIGSYSEVSPGGGLHIYCKGSVPTGRNVKPFEIYSSGRFGTVTGNPYKNVPIVDAQGIIDEYYAWLETRVKKELKEFDKTFDREQTQSDAVVLDIAKRAENGAKFMRLWQGDYHTDYAGDQSRADFALINMLCFYSQNRRQIRRLFLQSGLGARDKAKRVDYLDTMIMRSFDNVVPMVPMEDVSSFADELGKIITGENSPRQMKEAEAAVIANRKKERIEKIKSKFTVPGGMVGDIAQFVFQRAWKPVPEIATVGALAFMAGLCGKAYNVNGSGLNLYMLMLAKTGRGKEAINTGFDSLFKEIEKRMPTIRSFQGPSDLASGQGLLRTLSDHPTKSFVSVFGEFGHMLKRITGERMNSADLMTQRVMLDLYSKSGINGHISPTAYSDAERNTQPIVAPGFSFVGECTPTWFNNNVNLQMIASGLLPRFIICEYTGERVKSNRLSSKVLPSQQLIEQICAVASTALNAIQQGAVIDVGFTERAADWEDKLDVLYDAKINDSDSDVRDELFNRAHLNVTRVAALLAVGDNYLNPVIDIPHLEWASEFVGRNLQILEAKFDSGEIVSEETIEVSQIQITESIIVEACTYVGNSKTKPNVDEMTVLEKRVIPYSLLSRILRRHKAFKEARGGSTMAIQRVIKGFIDAGDLQEISPTDALSKLKTRGKCYAVTSERLRGKIREKIKQASQLAY